MVALIILEWVLQLMSNKELLVPQLDVELPVEEQLDVKPLSQQLNLQPAPVDQLTSSSSSSLTEFTDF